MSTLEALADVQALLQAIAPTYRRSTLKEDTAPQDPRHFILDDVSLTAVYGLGKTASLYDYVVIQVSAWAKSSLASYELSEQARGVLEPLLWQIQSGRTADPDGPYRGHQITYRKLF